jgi:hypothetical protein
MYLQLYEVVLQISVCVWIAMSQVDLIIIMGKFNVESQSVARKLVLFTRPTEHKQ